MTYRPSGHADRFLRAWIDLASESASDSAPAGDDRLVTVRATLLDRDAPGRCGKCHRPTGPTGWSASRADPQRGLTGFRHAPHLRLGQDCTSCHRTATDGSGFEPITKADCSGCHAQERAGDACLVCHVYHWRGTP